MRKDEGDKSRKELVDLVQAFRKDTADVRPVSLARKKAPTLALSTLPSLGRTSAAKWRPS